MKIVIGTNPRIELDVNAVITKNHCTRIYLAFNQSLYEDLKGYLKELSTLIYHGKAAHTIENNDNKSMVIVF